MCFFDVLIFRQVFPLHIQVKPQEQVVLPFRDWITPSVVLSGSIEVKHVTL